jgi:L,D-transpeptidase ErfK/SrfK
MESREAVVSGDMVGTVRSVRSKHEDVVFDIARKNDVGILEVLAANPGLDPWLPGQDTRITLPTAHIFPQGPRSGIVVNVAELRLYYFKGAQLLMTAPIGIGRDGYKTPLGATKVVKKQKDPTWYLTKSERADHPELPAAVKPGPDNPLGAYALRLGWPSYLIHGTNTPDGVGQWSSRGCIRLYPDDIQRLYALVPVGTVVRVVDQPIKLGWRDGELFLQAYPAPKQFDELSLERRPGKAPLARDEAWIKAKLGPKVAGIDWSAVRHALENRTGLPVQITHTDKPVSAAGPFGFF